MKKLIICLIVVTIFIQGKDIGIVDELTDKVISSTSKSSFTALLLLNHLKISDYEYTKLSKLYKKETDVIKKLFIANIFINRAIGEYELDFIKLFPIGNKQSGIISISYDTEYVHVISPLYTTLINLSYSNQEALYKLLSSLEFVQGSYSELLSNTVGEIYKINPKYVEDTAKKYNIDLKKIQLKLR